MHLALDIDTMTLPCDQRKGRVLQPQRHPSPPRAALARPFLLTPGFPKIESPARLLSSARQRHATHPDDLIDA